MSKSATKSVVRRSCARENRRGAPTHQDSSPTAKAEMPTSEARRAKRAEMLTSGGEAGAC
jgi:hypothetical protein